MNSETAEASSAAMEHPPYNFGSLCLRHTHALPNKPLQDHAVVRDVGLGTHVLAVADGASQVWHRGEVRWSHAQAGAILIAELAAKAVPGDADPVHTQAAVEEALRTLSPACLALRERALFVFSTTLVLAVVTRSWSAVWMAGDGSYTLLTDSGRRIQDEVHMTVLDYTARRVIGGQALQRVAFTEERIVHAFVATDGLRDEPALARAIREPVRDGEELTKLCTRSPGCDDLALAYASVAGHGRSEASSR